MKKIVFFVALLLALPVCAQAEQKESPAVTREIVTQLAGEYGLNSDKYAPAFKNEDIIYWSQSRITRPQLKKEFHLRRIVLALAKKADYPIKTQGDLSFFAEKLREKQITMKGVYKALLNKKKLEIEASHRPKGPSRESIKELAKQMGLMHTRGFAPIFSDGDAAYWAGLNWDEASLKREFGFRAKVIELAIQVGYQIPTQGDLSFFAEQLRDGQVTEKILLQELLNKTSPI